MTPSIRTHVGVLCQQAHLDHRTLAEARRCDAETAEAEALDRYLHPERPRLGRGADTAGAAGRLLTLTIAAPIFIGLVITGLAFRLVRLVVERG